MGTCRGVMLWPELCRRHRQQRARRREQTSGDGGGVGDGGNGCSGSSSGVPGRRVGVGHSDGRSGDGGRVGGRGGGGSANGIDVPNGSNGSTSGDEWARAGGEFTLVCFPPRPPLPCPPQRRTLNKISVTYARPRGAGTARFGE